MVAGSSPVALALSNATPASGVAFFIRLRPVDVMVVAELNAVDSLRAGDNASPYASISKSTRSEAHPGAVAESLPRAKSHRRAGILAEGSVPMSGLNPALLRYGSEL